MHEIHRLAATFPTHSQIPILRAPKLLGCGIADAKSVMYFELGGRMKQPLVRRRVRGVQYTIALDLTVQM